MGIVHRANSHAPVSIAVKLRLTLISTQLSVFKAVTRLSPSRSRFMNC